MAEIPSDIASSAAQAGYRAREVGQARGARSAAQANAVDRRVKAVDEADTTVDTDDADARVFADAEGSGSMGRPFEEEGAAESEETPEQSSEGITRDDDGQVHLDLEA